MRLTRLLAWTTLLGTAGCQGCGALPIDGPDDPTLTETAEHSDSEVMESADTAPEPPCEIPEIEPNNSAEEANILPLERWGCGEFDRTIDADFWEFDLAETGWMAVRVDAWRLGSRADVSLTITSEEADVFFNMYAFQDTPDVRVAFPSPAAHFDALIRQTVGGGTAGEGERYFYEVRASSVKPPLVWDTIEADNDSRESPQNIVTGITDPGDPLTVFGQMEAPGDEDWYEIIVPPGRHTVTLDIEAHDFGSVGDFALERYKEGNTAPSDRKRAGLLGIEQDAYMTYDTYEAERILVKVIEEDTQTGRPYWYVLSVTVEE